LLASVYNDQLGYLLTVDETWVELWDSVRLAKPVILPTRVERPSSKPEVSLFRDQGQNPRLELEAEPGDGVNVSEKPGL
jgi:hypothetical protein